jgi:hypothetical protein
VRPDARPTNGSAWLPRLLAIAGVVETAMALALLAAPSGVASILLGSELATPGEVVGRIAGAGLLSLGIACWFARDTASAPASVGVAWALVVYNAVACATLAWAVTAMASGSLPALGASVLHGAFALALLGALISSGRT